MLTDILLIVIGAGILFLLFYFFYFKFLSQGELKKASNFKAILVSIPKELKQKEGEQPKDFKELISVFEQLLSNLHSMGKGQRLSFEIIALNDSIYFYVFAPSELISLAEKQIHSFYPPAHIEEDPHFRFFSTYLNGEQEGVIRGAYLTLNKKFIYPLKTYLKLESEPLNAVTNALSKLGDAGQAVISIMVRPKSDQWQFQCQKEARKIQEGKRPGEVPSASHVLSDIGRAARGEHPQNSQEPYRPPTITPIDESRVKAFQEKAGKAGFETQVKIITVAKTEQEAEAHLSNILSSFAQFNSAEINSIKSKKVGSGEITRNYILKSFGFGPTMILNTEEIASLFHFPNRLVETPKIHWLLAKRMPPPSNLSKEGT